MENAYFDPKPSYERGEEGRYECYQDACRECRKIIDISDNFPDYFSRNKAWAQYKLGRDEVVVVARDVLDFSGELVRGGFGFLDAYDVEFLLQQKIKEAFFHGCPKPVYVPGDDVVVA